MDEEDFAGILEGLREAVEDIKARQQQKQEEAPKD